MDPLSLTTSIIALAETGTTLGKLIWDTCDNFRSARSDMQDMAEEVDLVTSLFTGLGSSMKRAPDLYSEEFRRMAKNLIAKCHKLFVEISEMFPSDVDEMGHVVRQYEKLVWSTFTKDRIMKRQTELRQMQHMFSFMETMQRYIERPENNQVGVNTGSGATNLAVGGIPQQIPIQLSGSVPGQGLIQVTLTLQSPPVTARYAETAQLPPSDSEKIRERNKVRLQNLRMSPYFSKSLLDEPEVESRTARPKPVATATYEQVITIDPKTGEETDEAVVDVDPDESDEPDDEPHAPPTRQQAAADVDDLIAWWSKLPQQTQPSETAQPPPSVQPREPSIDEISPIPAEGSQRSDTPRASEIQFRSMLQPQSHPQAGVGYGIPERGPPVTDRASGNSNPALAQTQAQTAPGTQTFDDFGSRPRSKRTYSVTCQGCSEGIEGVRHKCSECPDFNYCGQCYKYPPLRHMHPMSDFVQIR